MLERFFPGEIKRDRQGIFIYYGSLRLRPPKRSKFEEGMEISMIFTDEKFRSTQSPLRMYVFADLKEYEIWQTRPQK